MSDAVLACSNLSGVVLRTVPRATMKFAPAIPLKLGGFRSLFRSLLSCRGVTHAGVSFTSSGFSRRKSREVEGRPAFVRIRAVASPGSKVVCRTTIAQAVRASLLASAHATTFECRRVRSARVQSARWPFRFSRHRMYARAHWTRRHRMCLSPRREIQRPLKEPASGALACIAAERQAQRRMCRVCHDDHSCNRPAGSPRIASCWTQWLA